MEQGQNLPQQRQGQGQGQGGFIMNLIHYALMYFIITSFSSKIFPKKTIIITNDDAAKLNNEVKLTEVVNISDSSFFSTLSKLKPVTFKVPVFPTHDSAGYPLGPHQCAFHKGTVFDYYVLLSDNSSIDFNNENQTIVWQLKSVVLDWLPAGTPPSSLTLNIKVTDYLLNNGSLFAHVIFALSGMPIDPSHVEYENSGVFSRTISLVRFKPKRKTVVTRKLLDSPAPSELSASSVNISVDVEGGDTSLKLLSGSHENDNGSISQQQLSSAHSVVGHWTPSLDMAMVMDIPSFPRNAVPSNIGQHLQFLEDGRYFPLLYHNDFWLMSKQYLEINGSLSELPLTLSLQPISFWKFTMQISLEEQWKMQQSMGTGTERDSDVLREVLLETNPYLLVVTMVVSLLHMLFDMLAFKNDIQFWRKKKSMVGMSTRTMAVNCFFQVVILLYLFDNDTSYMILISSTIGLLIEFWKLAKAFKIRPRIVRIDGTSQIAATADGTDATPTAAPTHMFSMLIPYTLVFDKVSSATTAAAAGSEEDSSSSEVMAGKSSNGNNDRHTSSDSQAVTDTDNENLEPTKKYDAEATSHLLIVCLPLVVGFAVYSLIHRAHKSFYSWFLGSLVGFVYTFGFILMTPQLYINYKLKSVAHMPWKAMVYKALNTFIDDLFAFVIKMPVLHRLSCFRDDIIFFVYLYQRYVYRVDYTRTNEFGQGGEGGGGEGSVMETKDRSDTSNISSIGSSNNSTNNASSAPSTLKSDQRPVTTNIGASQLNCID